MSTHNTLRAASSLAATVHVRSAPGHPTRRDDGRTPNPRAAETALATAMNAPVETLELLDQPENNVS